MVANGLGDGYSIGKKAKDAPTAGVGGMASAQRLAARAASIASAPAMDAAEAAPPTENEVPAAVAPAPPRRHRKRDQPTWAELHTRRTFILTRSMSDAIDAEVRADEDLSFAEAASEAFEAWLARRRRAARKAPDQGAS